MLPSAKAVSEQWSRVAQEESSGCGWCEQMWAVLQRRSAVREAENWEILAGVGRKGRIAEPERRTGRDPEPKGKHT